MGETGNLVYYRAGNSIDEYQANEFAAAFLMPRDMYKNVMDQYTTGNIVETGKVAEFLGFLFQQHRIEENFWGICNGS